MQRSSAKRRIGSPAPIAAIVLNQGPQAGERSRAGLLLVVFMRLVALLWIVEGLLHWNAVFGLTFDGRGPASGPPAAETDINVFFAIIDLVASVGLWLATPWGGVIWLVSAGAKLLVALVLPGFYPHPWLTALAAVVLVSLYIVLTWRVAVAADQLSL